ncbi:MAG TPA: hypothetical protein PKD72_11160, partial [Gemmatales bacterium]|nr:hypothetical protein [Gemmatales bacterium]
ASYYQVIDDMDNCEKSHKERLDYLQTKDNPGELASALAAYGNFLRRSRNDCTKALGYFDHGKKKLEEIGLSLARHTTDSTFELLEVSIQGDSTSYSQAAS